MLKFPDVKYYKTDLTGLNRDNKVTREYHSRVADSKDVIFLPRQGHFFHKSFKMLKLNGEEYDLGKDYEFYDISRSLTALVKNATIGLFVKLLNPEITEWYCTYQVVGNFSIIDRDFATKILSALNDDRPVYFKDIKNMLKWFPPKLHQHDLRYEVHSFKDLIDQIVRIEQVYNVLPDRETVSINHFYSTISAYIAEFKKRLQDALIKHDGDKVPPYTNSHGLTAKKVGLEKVDNFKTASLIQIIEGIEEQLHITADLTKQVVAKYPKESDNLIHKGILPIIRYGNNNFIPPSISGSFEGLGGTNFSVGLNTETDGTTLLLGNRADGKVDGLYFMRNTDQKLDVTKWEFTAYRYTHPQAVADGVNLKYVVRGSNGKVLIVHDGSKYYWTFGNGTFNPNKHVLKTFPQEMYDLGIFNSEQQLYLVTAAYPDKVLLFKTLSPAEVWNDPALKQVAWDLPDYSAGVNYAPVASYASTSTGSVMGVVCWELDVPSQTWREVIFNYNYVGSASQFKSRLYKPFRHVIQPNVTYPDGSKGYGITQGFVKFKIPVYAHYGYQLQAFWGKYDKATKSIAMKHFFDSLIVDSRGFNATIGVNSMGFLLQNGRYENNKSVYDVVPGKILNGGIVDVDNSPVGGFPQPAGWYEPWNFRNVAYYSYLIKDDVLFGIAPGGYGGYPCQIATADLSQDAAFLSFDQFYKTAFDSKFTATDHNETNPLGLAISPSAECYLLPTLNNVNTYGSICTSLPDGDKTKYKLVYRRTDAMAADKSMKAPATSYTLYGTTVKGYPLSNDVRMVDLDPYFPINTFILKPSEPNWNAYNLARFSHITVPIPYQGPWNNATANQIFKSEVAIDFGNVLKFNATKTLNLSTIVDNVIIPYVTSWANANNHAGDFENLRANYMLIPATVNGGTTDHYLFIGYGLTADNHVVIIGQLMRITGGSYDANGLRIPTGVTWIGNMMSFIDSVPLNPTTLAYRTKNANQFIVQDYVNHAPIRPVIAQQPDQTTMVFSDIPPLTPSTGGYYRSGFVALFDINGLKRFDYKRQHHSAPNQLTSAHPYYQVMIRNNSYNKGAGIFGAGLTQNTATNNMDNLLANTTDPGLVLSVSNYVEGAFSVYFKSSETVVFGGSEYSLPPRVIDLYDVDSSPVNKTFYCYLTYVNGVVQYRIEPTPLADSYSCALLATIKTNGTGIYQILPSNVFTMNGFRIGIERHGSTIPAATGVIQTAGQTAGWADNATDLS